MGFPEMIVALVAITSFAEVIKMFIKRRGEAPSKSLLAEIRAMREEMQQLRQESRDVLLGVDNAVDRLENRMLRVESRLSLPSGQAEEEAAAQVAGRAR